MIHFDAMWLIISLILLITVSAFFSASETGMMAINRYKLRHEVREGSKKARRVSLLLLRPDHLLSVILIGNTFANILAASIVTILTINFFGEKVVILGSAILTVVILIFGEIMPKTVAALNSRRVAFWVARPLRILLVIFYPIVWAVNFITHSILKIFGVKLKRLQDDSLNSDELRSVVHEAKAMLPGKYSSMLLGILDLQRLTVDDVMVPRNEIENLDISSEWEKIKHAVLHSQHTRLPVYSQQLDELKGILHLHDALVLIMQQAFTRDNFEKILEKPYFVPEGTPLYTQLLNFQHEKRRQALVVDEYGDIQGLITVEDILEEIVGEFAEDNQASESEIRKQSDGSYIVDGGTSIREINRSISWKLPTNGPKTISGLVIDCLQAIPAYGTCVKIGNYPIEVIEIENNRVKLARIYPALESVGAQSNGYL